MGSCSAPTTAPPPSRSLRTESGRFRSFVALVATALALPGCMAQATQEWALNSPDGSPRVTRIQVGNELVKRGPLVRGELTVAEGPNPAVRSGGGEAGYGWRIEHGPRAEDDDTGSYAIDVSLLGRVAVGRPALGFAVPLELENGERFEIGVSAPNDPANESLKLIGGRVTLVIGAETSRWFHFDDHPWRSDRVFDASIGIGLRFGLFSEAGPPLSRWLSTLF